MSRRMCLALLPLLQEWGASQAYSDSWDQNLGRNVQVLGSAKELGISHRRLGQFKAGVSGAFLPLPQKLGHYNLHTGSRDLVRQGQVGFGLLFPLLQEWSHHTQKARLWSSEGTLVLGIPPLASRMGTLHAESWDLVRQGHVGLRHSSLSFQNGDITCRKLGSGQVETYWSWAFLLLLPEWEHLSYTEWQDLVRQGYSGLWHSSHCPKYLPGSGQVGALWSGTFLPLQV